MGCLLITGIVASVYGNDWPVWRGPTANGISEESGWSHKKAQVSWKKELGEGYSAVCVRGDRLYTMGHKLGEKKMGEDVVYCLNAKTGEELWRYEYPAETGS
jgi:outer membrane protein assembly factor BamB